MPRRLPLSRRLSSAARWPAGVLLTSWSYMWRTTPMHRRELPGSAEEDAPPALGKGVERGELQEARDGVGPLFHRRYRARIRGSALGPEELLGRVAGDPNRVAPTELASFHKVRGDEGRLQPGDEYVVRMPGPWDGPVRVVDVTPTSFRLATLDGHLEAGTIEFRARGDGQVVFEIESWARSGDRLSNLLYHRLRMAKEVQLHMWTSFLERVARLSGGRLTGGIDIDTRRVDRPGALEGLRARGVNFDLAGGPFTPARGWHVDDYRRALPPEPPGAPVPGGSWEVARRLLCDYDFARDSSVHAIFDRDAPLEGRDMLLELRFLGLRFDVGVRVGEAYDVARRADGREARVWGWSYRTLEGHLEEGQMAYELWKWPDSGEVEFRIHAFSRRAPIDNPLVRLGFRLFGRREQLKFYRHACDELARLTGERLEATAVAQARAKRMR